MKNRIAGQTSGRIRDALLTLLKEEQSLGKITIAALSDEAGISRRTFYRYYASKEEILTTYIASLINDYIAKLRQSRLEKFEDFVFFSSIFGRNMLTNYQFYKRQTYSHLL
ncbi:hypothetical protein GCM10025884_10270 [Leuconostoc gelidum subsp. gelidum]|nr:hypothetical protein GCM10025884_10270 [Leuconostoc gelidum subsp. gelidum]